MLSDLDLHTWQELNERSLAWVQAELVQPRSVLPRKRQRHEASLSPSQSEVLSSLLQERCRSDENAQSNVEEPKASPETEQLERCRPRLRRATIDALLGAVDEKVVFVDGFLRHARTLSKAVLRMRRFAETNVTQQASLLPLRRVLSCFLACYDDAVRNLVFTLDGVEDSEFLTHVGRWVRQWCPLMQRLLCFAKSAERVAKRENNDAKASVLLHLATALQNSPSLLSKVEVLVLSSAFRREFARVFSLAVRRTEVGNSCSAFASLCASLVLSDYTESPWLSQVPTVLQDTPFSQVFDCDLLSVVRDETPLLCEATPPPLEKKANRLKQTVQQRLQGALDEVRRCNEIAHRRSRSIAKQREREAVEKLNEEEAQLKHERRMVKERQAAFHLDLQMQQSQKRLRKLQEEMRDVVDEITAQQTHIDAGNVQVAQQVAVLKAHGESTGLQRALSPHVAMRDDSDSEMCETVDLDEEAASIRKRESLNAMRSDEASSDHDAMEDSKSDVQLESSLRFTVQADEEAICEEATCEKDEATHDESNPYLDDMRATSPVAEAVFDAHDASTRDLTELLVCADANDSARHMRLVSAASQLSALPSRLAFAAADGFLRHVVSLPRLLRQLADVTLLMRADIADTLISKTSGELSQVSSADLEEVLHEEHFATALRGGENWRISALAASEFFRVRDASGDWRSSDTEVLRARAVLLLRFAAVPQLLVRQSRVTHVLLELRRSLHSLQTARFLPHARRVAAWQQRAELQSTLRRATLACTSWLEQLRLHCARMGDGCRFGFEQRDVEDPFGVLRTWHACEAELDFLFVPSTQN
ncbi:MAG: hypothetical protein MHM6MM_006060 [Cercozoa sp. M6MM]